MNGIWWLAAMVVFVIIELSTFNFITIWFAGGALFSLISSLLGLKLIWQMWIFIITSLILLILTKPLINKKLKKEKTPTNADRIINKTGIVTEDIREDKFAGKVKCDGQIWSAVSENGEFIEKESKVKILRIEGVKLIVKKYKNRKE